MTNELSSKVTRLYNPYTPLVVILILGGYTAVCYYYFSHFPEPMLQPVIGHLSFMGFLLLGIAAVIVIPILFSITISYLVFEKDGVVENRGYLFGLFKIPEIRMQWSDFEAWEADYTIMRGSQKKAYYIKLFPKNAQRFFISENDKHWHNGTEIKWKTFEQHLKALFNEVGLPDRMKDWEEIIQDDINEEK
jgi:hypothetical protein